MRKIIFLNFLLLFVFKLVSSTGNEDESKESKTNASTGSETHNIETSGTNASKCGKNGPIEIFITIKDNNFHQRIILHHASFDGLHTGRKCQVERFDKVSIEVLRFRVDLTKCDPKLEKPEDLAEMALSYRYSFGTDSDNHNSLLTLHKMGGELCKEEGSAFFNKMLFEGGIRLLNPTSKSRKECCLERIGASSSSKESVQIFTPRELRKRPLERNAVRDVRARQTPASIAMLPSIIVNQRPAGESSRFPNNERIVNLPSPSVMEASKESADLIKKNETGIAKNGPTIIQYTVTNNPEQKSLKIIYSAMYNFAFDTATAHDKMRTCEVKWLEKDNKEFTSILEFLLDLASCKPALKRPEDLAKMTLLFGYTVGENKFNRSIDLPENELNNAEFFKELFEGGVRYKAPLPGVEHENPKEFLEKISAKLESPTGSSESGRNIG